MKLPACCHSLTVKCLLLCCCAVIFISEAARAADSITSAPSATRAAELKHLLRQDCGACHGLTLNGGLGSPLTATALADKPAAALVATVLQGRPGTAMPPWQAFMSEAEARWLIQQLQQGIKP